MSTRVQLEIFEGPLDLLLHLIKKNQVSITDIPIAAITEQYLATLELMQSLNLDVAGEFLVMAATLIHIKSRMLLPAGDDEADDDEGVDPRDELVRRLLEYQRFKEAADQLERREILSRDVFVRTGVPTEESPPAAFRELSVFELLAALGRVLERLPSDDDVHEVTLEKITVREKMTLLLDTLRSSGKVLFESLFNEVKSRMEVVVTFLAMLELVRGRAVRIFQEEATGPIIIEAAVGIDEAAMVAIEESEEKPHGT
ncbi:MAG TPA: segregation/condensation protein A [Candidatus Udaeobacter sp.]|nr:segregation/condensation protein A [Candidatus Udaeobacter sp.]